MTLHAVVSSRYEDLQPPVAGGSSYEWQPSAAATDGIAASADRCLPTPSPPARAPLPAHGYCVSVVESDTDQQAASLSFEPLARAIVSLICMSLSKHRYIRLARPKPQLKAELPSSVPTCSPAATRTNWTGIESTLSDLIITVRAQERLHCPRWRGSCPTGAATPPSTPRHRSSALVRTASQYSTAGRRSPTPPSDCSPTRTQRS